MRFDPCVGLDGRRFLVMLGISEAARCLGLPSLFAHLCKQAIKRGQHRFIIEGDGALLGGRFVVRFAFGVDGGIYGGRASGWSPPARGGLLLGRDPRGRHGAL